jgi:alpha-D-ribose 1-methylphosphonate 5-triphosphate synthase subunit PhnH
MYPYTRDVNTTWIVVPGSGQDEAIYIVDTQTNTRVAMTCYSSMGRSQTDERDAALLAALATLSALDAALLTACTLTDSVETFWLSTEWSCESTESCWLRTLIDCDCVLTRTESAAA